MTTADAIVNLDAEIAQVLKEWATKYDGVDPVPAHVLDTVSEEEKLYAMNAAAVQTAMAGQPRGLYELTETSVEPKLYDVDQLNYVRKPADVVNTGEDLDMDEGLAMAVVYYAVDQLCADCDRYGTLGNKVVKEYLSAYKSYDKTIPVP